jgi:Ca-activated chloride channel family protein
LDANGKPTETNVNMTFYDNFSGLPLYNFIHTLNSRGVPDTLDLDPLVVYDLTVYTIPPVHRDSIRLTSGKHNIIAVETPQGSLSFKASGNYQLKNTPCIIRQKGKNEIINVQQFDQTENYLTGKYEAEILCLPKIRLTDVEIRQSQTTQVEIPLPGIAVIRKSANGYGSLYLEEKNQSTWLYNFKDTPQLQETLSLQPGSYRVVFRSRFSSSVTSTVEKQFTVEPGQTVVVNLYTGD